MRRKWSPELPQSETPSMVIALRGWKGIKSWWKIRQCVLYKDCTSMALWGSGDGCIGNSISFENGTSQRRTYNQHNSHRGLSSHLSTAFCLNFPGNGRTGRPLAQAGYPIRPSFNEWNGVQVGPEPHQMLHLGALGGSWGGWVLVNQGSCCVTRAGNCLSRSSQQDTACLLSGFALWWLPN
jgi:hypothetical protein